MKQFLNHPVGRFLVGFVALLLGAVINRYSPAHKGLNTADILVLSGLALMVLVGTEVMLYAYFTICAELLRTYRLITRMIGTRARGRAKKPVARGQFASSDDYELFRAQALEALE